MAKLLKFVKDQLLKAGLSVDDERFKAAVAAINPDLELDDTIVTALDSGLLSLATAKNNHPDISNHYKASFFNGLDAELDRFLQAEQLDADTLAEISAEKSSTKRATLIAKKIKEVEAKKAQASQGDKNALAQQIADLNRLLREEKDAHEATKGSMASQLAEQAKDFQLDTMLGAYKTIHDGLDPTTKRIIIRAVLDKGLAAKRAVLKVNDQKELIIVDKDGNNVFSDANIPFTAKAFIDHILASEKQLVTSQGNQNNNGSNGQQSSGQQWQQQQTGSNGQQSSGQQGQQQQSGGNSTLKQLLRESQANFNKGSGFSSGV